MHPFEKAYPLLKNKLSFEKFFNSNLISMDNHLENKLSMYQKVQGFLVKHESELSGITAVSELKVQFDEKVQSILNLAATAGADLTGYTVEKQNKRTELKQRTLKLSTALVAYGSLHNEPRLLEKCDENVSTLDKMRDNDLYAYARLILAEAHDLLSVLVPLGVTQEDYDKADQMSGDYLKFIQEPRLQINERSMALSQLETLFDETDVLLYSKLDKVLKIFSVTQPNLYVGYEGARGIDQTGAHSPADYTVEVDAGKTLLLADLPYLASRQFEVQNTGKVALTFALSTTENQLEGKAFTVEPGASAVRTTSQLHEHPKAHLLYAHNADATLPGNCKVWVIE